MSDELYAFPSLHTIDGNWNKEPNPKYRGMTLRDQFAMAALQALIAKSPVVMWSLPGLSPSGVQNVEGAWDYADAMLAAREKK